MPEDIVKELGLEKRFVTGSAQVNVAALVMENDLVMVRLAVCVIVPV